MHYKSADTSSDIEQRDLNLHFNLKILIEPILDVLSQKEDKGDKVTYIGAKREKVTIDEIRMSSNLPEHEEIRKTHGTMLL